MSNTKRKIVTLIFLLLTIFSYGQRKTKLNTNGEGSMFFSAGLNRSGYSTTNVVLTGGTYSISLEGMLLSDNSEGVSPLSFFNSSSPQFNFQLGYFIAPKWAITGGFDRYNTFFRESQDVQLSGTFSPSSHSNFSGTYNSESISLNLDDFNVVQTQGMNYFNIGVLRMDQWFKSRKAEFAFNTVMGGKLGPIFTIADYTFDSSTRQQVSSLSGVGFSGFLGVRLDLFQHIYLEAIVTGGYLNQNNIKVSSNGSETVSQKTAFISPQINLGFSFFARPTNGCGTCPNW